MKWFSGSCPPSLYHLTHLANVNPTYIFPIYYSVQKVFNDTNQKQSWQLFFYVSWLSEAIWKKKSKQKKWVTKFSLSWNSKRTFEGNSDPYPWYINESWNMMYWVDVHREYISLYCEWSSWTFIFIWAKRKASLNFTHKLIIYRLNFVVMLYA